MEARTLFQDNGPVQVAGTSVPPSRLGRTRPINRAIEWRLAEGAEGTIRRISPSRPAHGAIDGATPASGAAHAEAEASGSSAGGRQK
jgi:hypothetical protein